MTPWISHLILVFRRKQVALYLRLFVLFFVSFGSAYNIREMFTYWIAATVLHPSGQGSQALTYFLEIRNQSKSKQNTKTKQQEAIKHQTTPRCRKIQPLKIIIIIIIIVYLCIYQLAVCWIGTFPIQLHNIPLCCPSEWTDRYQYRQSVSASFHHFFG